MRVFHEQRLRAKRAPVDAWAFGSGRDATTEDEGKRSERERERGRREAGREGGREGGRVGKVAEDGFPSLSSRALRGISLGSKTPKWHQRHPVRVKLTNWGEASRNLFLTRVGNGAQRGGFSSFSPF